MKCRAMTKECTSCVHFLVMFTNTPPIRLVMQVKHTQKIKNCHFLVNFALIKTGEDAAMIARLFQSIVNYNYHCLPSPLSFIYSISILLYLFCHHRKKDFFYLDNIDQLVQNPSWQRKYKTKMNQYGMVEKCSEVFSLHVGHSIAISSLVTHFASLLMLHHCSLL